MNTNVHVGNGTVHPRVRGERGPLPTNAVAVLGSSPRARGTRKLACSRVRIHRFIPACAGNATTANRFMLPPSVHPRVRGERIQPVPHAFLLTGSSPRARGTLREALVSHFHHRFIPACAGNADLGDRMTQEHPVHPRVRGERWGRDSACRSQVGSSPRARGTPSFSPFPWRPCRFIPACAGNAFVAHSQHILTTVHPRVRGERASAWLSSTIGGGSSPRARGTHRGGGNDPFNSRFIPACAGNAMIPPTI